MNLRIRTTKGNHTFNSTKEEFDAIYQAWLEGGSEVLEINADADTVAIKKKSIVSMEFWGS